MSGELLIETTPNKPANYEVSIPGEEGLVAFTHREEMFKYLNMKLDTIPEGGETEDGDDEEESGRTVFGG